MKNLSFREGHTALSNGANTPIEYMCLLTPELLTIRGFNVVLQHGDLNKQTKTTKLMLFSDKALVGRTGTTNGKVVWSFWVTYHLLCITGLLV